MTSETFRQGLLDSGHLTFAGIPGVYHHSLAFGGVMRGLEDYLSAAGSDRPRHQLLFSPIIARSMLQRSGYLTSFPNLIGVISSYAEGAAKLPELYERVARGAEWCDLLSATDLALCSAACQPLYPMLANSSISSEGRYYEIQTTCFRHEWSDDPARMQTFTQREFVYVGTEEGAIAHREEWLRRGFDLLADLGLAVQSVVANDPFFGREGKLMGSVQREKEQKFEIIAPITSETPGAISSVNFHEDHFGEAYNISVEDGERARTACVGFGLERITLALLLRHGTDIGSWPVEVRERLHLVSVTSPEARA